MPETLRPVTIRYLRRQLRLTAADLDTALHIPLGTTEAAEDGQALLPPVAILRLKNMVCIAERAGQIPERQHVGQLLRDARVAMGFTQQEVADKIGLKVTSYGRTESVPNPRLATVQRVAAALGIPLDWILRGNVPLTDNLDGGTLNAPDSPRPQHGG